MVASLSDVLPVSDVANCNQRVRPLGSSKAERIDRACFYRIEKAIQLKGASNRYAIELLERRAQAPPSAIAVKLLWLHSKFFNRL